MQVLLGKGKVDVNYKNKFGDALLFGLWMNSTYGNSGHEKVVQLLLGKRYIYI